MHHLGESRHLEDLTEKSRGKYDGCCCTHTNFTPRYLGRRDYSRLKHTTRAVDCGAVSAFHGSEQPIDRIHRQAARGVAHAHETPPSHREVSVVCAERF